MLTESENELMKRRPFTERGHLVVKLAQRLKLRKVLQLSDRECAELQRSIDEHLSMLSADELARAERALDVHASHR